MTDDFEERLSRRLTGPLPAAPESLQARVVDMDDRWNREAPPSRWRPLLPILAPIALVAVLAAGLVQLGLLGPGGSGSSSAAASGPRGVETPAPTPFDPTHIVSGGRSYSITYEAGSIVIRRTVAGTIETLATYAAPPGAFASPPSGTRGGFGSTIACASAAGTGDVEMIYGFIVNDRGRGYTYSGPAADGGFSGNGLFLFVLRTIADDGQLATIEQNGSTPFDPPARRINASFHLGPAGAAGVVTLPSGCRRGVPVIAP
jgi:hypothetical protein